jgi:2-phosphoglycerate kinase
VARRLFVTGNPTAGKSHLAKMLVERIGARRGDGDAARFALKDDPRYADAVCFYLNQDEAAYYAKTTPEERWSNLVRQSETIWPALREWVERESAEAGDSPVVFEGVNLLPDLVARDFPGEVGCAILSPSQETVAARLAEKPRWGDLGMQAHEAAEFFLEQVPRYRALAETAGWPVFTSADEALPWALKQLG